jgi:uncharacterized tellurite resistance protein B-like protein
MLRRIRDFFDRNLLSAAPGAVAEEHRLQLAVAALLLEMSRMDDTVEEDECAAIEETIKERFGLSVPETRNLMDLARAEREDATDYFQFTSLINRHYSQEQRVQLVEHLWRVAYADSALHRYEEHLVRKVAQLLQVPHRAFIAAKHRVKPGG